MSVRPEVRKALYPARLHAVGEQGIALREIAGHLGKKLGLPVVAKSSAEAVTHYGFLAATVGTDQPASSAKTQELLGWTPREIELLPDLDANA